MVAKCIGVVGPSGSGLFVRHKSARGGQKSEVACPREESSLPWITYDNVSEIVGLRENAETEDG